MAKLVEKVYGDALFALGKEHDSLDMLVEESQMIGSMLKEYPDFGRMLSSPMYTREEKEQIMKESFSGKISQDMEGFLWILMEKGRFKALSKVFAYFQKQVKEYKKTGIVRVTSALPLSEMEKEKIREKLLVTTPYEDVEIQYQVDESLIGGVILQLGDKVVDGSLKYRFSELTSQLKRISLE